MCENVRTKLRRNDFITECGLGGCSVVSLPPRIRISEAYQIITSGLVKRFINLASFPRTRQVNGNTSDSEMRILFLIVILIGQ
jgi:hypothetical protein